MAKKLKDKILSLISPTYKKTCKIYNLLQNMNLYNNQNNSYNVFLSTINAGKEFGYNPKEYFIKENMPERINKLKENLDDISLYVIDKKIEHWLNFPLYGTKYSEACRFNTRDILYNEDEIKENKKFISLIPELKNKYKGDWGDEIIPESFYYHHGLKFLDKDILNKIQGKSFIDVGSVFGDSAIVLSEYNPSKIYSFDMIDNAKEKYFENLKLNNKDLSKFEFLNYGVSDKHEYKNLNTKTFSSLNKEDVVGGGGNTVEIVRLDDILLNNNIGLIKMDIEGAEYKAILGAEQIIKKYKPVLLITIYHTPHQFFELKPLIDSWNLGYKFMIRNLNYYRYSELETTLICY